MSNEVDLMKFGFVGLGQMGAPMAINLAQKHDVLVGVVRQSLTRIKAPRSHKPMMRRFGTTP